MLTYAWIKFEEELSPVCLRLGKDSSSNLISHLNSEFGGPAPNYSPSATKGQQHHSNALCQERPNTLCCVRPIMWIFAPAVGQGVASCSTSFVCFMLDVFDVWQDLACRYHGKITYQAAFADAPFISLCHLRHCKKNNGGRAPFFFGVCVVFRTVL